MKVVSVEPQKDFKLVLRFGDGSLREFDMKPYLDVGMYVTLKDPKLFATAHIAFDGVEWSNGVDIDPEFLYEHSKEIYAV
jgi:hypothetical protein